MTDRNTTTYRRLSRREWMLLVAGDVIRRHAKGAIVAESSILSSKHAGMIIHLERPLNLETPAVLLDTWITPIDRFYVRSHFYVPEIDAAKWRCSVDGLVSFPLSLSMQTLREFEPIERIVTLECAGNGRSRFRPRVPGTQWSDGSVGTARWRGVRLRDVLRKAGLDPGARHIVFDGADSKIGNSPDFIRSLPIEKCLDADTMLAFEMNGEALPIAHGFPLRLITPGWEGAACIKWLARITVQASEYDGPFMSRAYRMPTKPIEPGAPLDINQTAPITRLYVKSMITYPRPETTLAPGPVTIRGFAWAGPDGIAKVDVSTDGGRTWNQADLGSQQSRYAWREFRYEWKRNAGEGERILMARATDEQGLTQPLQASWNPSGYLRNVAEPVRAGGAPMPETAVQLPEGRGKEILDANCTACHSELPILRQRLSVGAWRTEISKMEGWGSPLSPDDKEALIDYLARHLSESR